MFFVIQNIHSENCSGEELLMTFTNELRIHLNNLNDEGAKIAAEHIRIAIDAIMGHVSYERVAENGLKQHQVTEKHTLATRWVVS